MTPFHPCSARPAVPRGIALLITAGLALAALLTDATAAFAVSSVTGSSTVASTTTAASSATSSYVAAAPYLPSSTAPPVAAAGAAPSRWVWPLSPRPEIVHRFDPPDVPWGPGHRGVDLLGSEGQPVRAAGAGVVTYAGLLAGREVVTVRHGDLRTTYQPVRPEVSVGAHVDAGTKLGLLRAAGGHCAPRTCLHWGLLRGDDYLDPLSLLGTGPPRLLPLDGQRSTDLDAPVMPELPPRRSGSGDGRGPGRAPAAGVTPAGLVAAPPAVADPPAVPPAVAAPPASLLSAASLPTGTRWTPFSGRTPSAGTSTAVSPLSTPSASAGDTDGQDHRLATSGTGMPALLTTVMAPAAGALAGAVAAGLLVRRSGAPMGRPPLPPSPPPIPAFGSARRLSRPRRRRPAPVVDLASMRSRSRRAA